MIGKKVNYPGYFGVKDVEWCNDNGAYISDAGIVFENGQAAGGYYQIKSSPDYKGVDEITLLQEAKEAKYNEANQGARAYLESGEALYELTPTSHIEATDGNIGKLGAYALGFITGLYKSDDVVYWNTKEDETITLNQEQLTQVIAGLGAVQAEVWNVKFPAYKAQIEACTTADEVNAIVIDYNVKPSIG